MGPGAVMPPDLFADLGAILIVFVCLLFFLLSFLPSLLFLILLSRGHRRRPSLTLSLTLCGLTSKKTHRGSLGLGGLVHEEAHSSFPYCTQTPLKCIDAGSTNCPLIQLILSINYSI